tara:strand:- start:463 stop:600 length:138 start_codon:yes stop_codon:yes gene_type:complete
MKEGLKRKLKDAILTVVAVKEVIVVGYHTYKAKRKAKFGKKNESR